MNDVIRATTALNKAPGKLEWRVLIVDMQSMKMVSACTKMHELSAEGIIQVKNGLGFEKKFRIDQFNSQNLTLFINNLTIEIVSAVKKCINFLQKE